MTPHSVDMSAVARVLIIKLSSFGDIIHALPVAAALKESFPHIELTWAVEEAFAPLVAGNPSIDHVLTLPKIRGRQLRSPAFHRDYFLRLRDVRKRKFDLTLDLQGLTKSAIVAAASGARLRLGYHWMREAASLFERAVPRDPASVHVVDQYLDVARFLGAHTDSPQFAFHVGPDDEAYAEALLDQAGLCGGPGFVTINPATSTRMKEWSAANFSELIDRLYSELDLRSALVTADRPVASKVAAHAGAPLANFAGKTNLKQLAAILKRGAVHICSDTGSAHLAAALGVPVIALVGPTDPDRICPYGQRENVIRHSERCGAACSWHRCNYVKPNCMDSISPKEVAARVGHVFATHA